MIGELWGGWLAAHLHGGIFVSNARNALELPANEGFALLVTEPVDADTVALVVQRVGKVRKLLLAEDKAASLLLVAIVMF